MLYMLISKFNTENVEPKIEAFEKKYRFHFPEEYRRFLLKYNGGRTVETNFRKKVASDLRGLYGFDDEAGNFNYNAPSNQWLIEEHLEFGMLPIGENDFGDYVMLGVSGRKKGKIFFYYHDRNRHYIKITDNFKDFVAVCKSHEIGHIRTIEERIECATKNGYKVTEGALKGWQDEIDFFNGIHQERVILD